MTAHLLAKLRRWAAAEAGVTLVEALIAIGILTSALSMVGLPLFSVLHTGGRIQGEMSATLNVRQAGGWVAQDAFAAQTISVGDGSAPVDSLSITWTDSGGGAHAATYAVDATNLVRTIDSSATTVARGVSLVEFSRSGTLLPFTIEVQTATGISSTATSLTLLRSLQ